MSVGRTRNCARCGEEKPMSDFPVSLSKRSGYSGICKACTPADPEQAEGIPPGVKQAMCTKKRRYATHGRALAVATRAAHRTTILRVYECPVCRGFHLTHKPAKEKP